MGEERGGGGSVPAAHPVPPHTPVSRADREVRVETFCASVKGFPFPL